MLGTKYSYLSLPDSFKSSRTDAPNDSFLLSPIDVNIILFSKSSISDLNNSPLICLFLSNFLEMTFALENQKLYFQRVHQKSFGI